MSADKMQDGEQVMVRMNGDDRWFQGVVTKARKLEVYIEHYYDNGQSFVADEHCIAEWRPVDPVSSGPTR